AATEVEEVVCVVAALAVHDGREAAARLVGDVAVGAGPAQDGADRAHVVDLDHVLEVVHRQRRPGQERRHRALRAPADEQLAVGGEEVDVLVAAGHVDDARPGQVGAGDVHHARGVYADVDVRSAATVDGVVAGAGVERLDARAAVDGVVALAAAQGAHAAAAALGAGQRVVAVAAVQQVGVVAGPRVAAGHLVIAALAEELSA